MYTFAILYYAHTHTPANGKYMLKKAHYFDIYTMKTKSKQETNKPTRIRKVDTRIEIERENAKRRTQTIQIK